MAWITKNSAGMQIERRDEPYLDDELKAELTDKYFPRYPTKQACTMPALHLVQEKHGYIPFQAIQEIADLLELPASTVYDTASFYEEYMLEPVGEHIIWVCQSLSCELCGESEITKRVKDELGIEVGETTKDGKFTLEKVECLGACGSAPCALVGEKLCENLTPDQFIQELKKID